MSREEEITNLRETVERLQEELEQEEQDHEAARALLAEHNMELGKYHAENRQLRDVVRDVQGYCAAVRQEGETPRVVHDALAHVQAMLGRAVPEGLYPVDECPECGETLLVVDPDQIEDGTALSCGCAGHWEADGERAWPYHDDDECHRCREGERDSP